MSTWYLRLDPFALAEQVAKLTSQLGEARSAGEASAGTSATELAALRAAQADLQARLAAAEEAAASAAEEVGQRRRQGEDAASTVDAVRAELRATTQRLQARSTVTPGSLHAVLAEARYLDATSPPLLATGFGPVTDSSLLWPSLASISRDAGQVNVHDSGAAILFRSETRTGCELHLLPEDEGVKSLPSQATEGTLGRAKAEAESLRRAARQQAEQAEVLHRDCTALARKVAEVETAVAAAPELPQVCLVGRPHRGPWVC